MTGSDLKHLRAERGWTLREMADFLGDVSPSGLSLWERDDKFEVPAWISAKLLTTRTLTLPLDELEELLNLARSEGLSFSELLAASIREYIAARTAAEPANVIPYELDPSAVEPAQRVAEAPDPDFITLADGSS